MTYPATDNSHDLPPHWSQRYDDCEPNAVLLAYIHHRVRFGDKTGAKDKAWWMPSRSFAYYNARKLMNGRPGQDRGCGAVNVLHALDLFGAVPEAMWPYTDDRAKDRLFGLLKVRQPTADVYADGRHLAGVTWRTLTDASNRVHNGLDELPIYDIEQFKLVTSQGHVWPAGVSEAGFRVVNGVLQVPDESLWTAATTFHEIAIVGFSADGLHAWNTLGQTTVGPPEFVIPWEFAREPLLFFDGHTFLSVS